MTDGSANSLAFAYFLLFGLAAIFGASFMLTKVAVSEIPPATIVASRLIVASMFVAGAMIWVGQSLIPLLEHWKTIVVVSLFGNALPFFLISWGQQTVDAGLTAILMAVMPLITIVLAHFFTAEEKLNRFKLMGFCLGLIGVAVLIGFDKLAVLGAETIGQIAIMAAACCYAIHAIISKWLTSMPRLAISVGVLFASAVIILPFSLVLDQPWTLTPSGNVVFSLLALGIFPTAIGTLMLFAIVERQGAGFLSQINFLVPLFGVLWAALFLGEVLQPNALVALSLILAGVGIARIKSSKYSLENAP